MTEYIPIACGLHSEYELAIMHRRRMRLCWRDERGGTHVERLLPRDLVTREGAEYLLAEASDGRLLELRLDYILHTEPR